MEVSSVNQIAASVGQAQTGDTVGILTLKKAIQLEGQLAMQLLEAIPQPPSNPPHLGQGIDVTA